MHLERKWERPELLYLPRYRRTRSILLHRLRSRPSAAISLVSNVAAASPNGLGFTTGSIDTTGATLLVANLASYAAEGSLSDSKGNTWTPLNLYSVLGNTQLRMYYAAGPVVGSGHNFIVGGGGVYASIEVAAFSGVVAASPFDQQNGSSASSGTSIATGSVTPSQNDELIIAGFGISNDLSGIAIGSSFVITDTMAYSPGASVGSSFAYLIQTTAGSVNPTWSWTSSGANAAAIATFKAVGVTIVPSMWHPETGRPVSNPIKVVGY